MTDVNYSEDIQLLIDGEHFNPHRFLGLHSTADGKKVVRLYHPGANHLFFELKGQKIQCTKIHDAGFFEHEVPDSTVAIDYRIYHKDGLLANDPYAFWPTLGEVDEFLFGRGVHYEIFKVLGGRLFFHQGVLGAKFSVWAPSAKRVSIVGDFNHWDGRCHAMRMMGASGIWEIFIPGLQEGVKYKFEIKTQQNKILLKSDPYGYFAELRPKTASILYDVEHYQWNDSQWIIDRTKKKDEPQPINIYEVHLGSWKLRDGQFLNYVDIAKELIAYCHDMHFTHIELLPLSEHPLDESWGYQVTGFYAVTSRFGSPRDFQAFVDAMHQAGIGVLIDWVPGHFPVDDFSLSLFDGTALYEHADVRQGFHPHWSTLIFNYGRNEVTNFLVGNAIFWCSMMHIDGFRVDAVASMLYLDYGRKEGEWIPNRYGGKDNLEAVEFLKHLNSVVHEKFPGVLTIAEESTSFPGITQPTKDGGIGFDYKWNMGWMNDTLRYFEKDMLFRHAHQNLLTFGLIYAFTERYILVLSHDEVVHGKKSLISKMPGDMWQQFANLRLIYTYTMCQPGKKLFFMSNEFGQWNEWNCKREIEWPLLQYPTHDGVRTMVKEINAFYLEHTALWERDDNFMGFEWVDFSDSANSVIVYRRKSSKGELICLHHFTPTYLSQYTIWISGILSVKEVFNSDDVRYGGSGKLNPAIAFVNDQGVNKGFTIELAPLATQIFEITF
ncbi:MAG: 1,4-alpha-glucan branching protein GlgB [Parachlamydiales bacterium]|nr:1,4-alpha-glucan branching protein GlgB [Parachlamydiales bacterium]